MRFENDFAGRVRTGVASKGKITDPALQGATWLDFGKTPWHAVLTETLRFIDARELAVALGVRVARIEQRIINAPDGLRS